MGGIICHLAHVMSYFNNFMQLLHLANECEKFIITGVERSAPVFSFRGATHGNVSRES